MPIIPLKQKITVKRVKTVNDPISDMYDGWGQPIPGDEITLDARVTEETKVVTNQAGEEAVTSLRIILDKLADVSYDDVITYTNETGVAVARKPVRIEIKRMLSGKPILTEVYL